MRDATLIFSTVLPENSNAGQGDGKRLLHGRQDSGDIIGPFPDKRQGQVQAGRIKIPASHAGHPQAVLQIRQGLQEDV